MIYLSTIIIVLGVINLSYIPSQLDQKNWFFVLINLLVGFNCILTALEILL